MRTLTITMLASAATLLSISVANAADAVEQIPQAPVAIEEAAAPAATWQGFYLGGYGEYDWGRFGGGDYDADGFGGGVFTGYNFQSGQIVYGLEADAGYNGQENTTGGITGEAGWNGSVRGRVGYDLNPFMIYGTAGVAFQNNELSDGVSSDDKTSIGYTVGAGAEAFVTNNITARVEYRYTDFASEDYSLAGGTVSRGFDDHSVKVGIGVKF